MKKTKRILVLAAMVASVAVIPASPSHAVDILAGRGTLTVFNGWGASGSVCFGQQTQEIIVGELSGAGVTQGPGVNTIHGAVPLLATFSTCASGSFPGPGTAAAGEATYTLIGTAPDGDTVRAGECIQTPGNARSCTYL